MPSWISGSRPETGLSLGDTTRSMIEFTPVVGDVLDLKEGTDFDNDLDWLERTLAIFAGFAPVAAGAGAIGMGAKTQMRNRHYEQTAGLYESLAETYRAPDPAGFRPMPSPTGPITSDMSPAQVRHHLGISIDDVRRKLRETHATADTGVEQEKLAFRRGDVPMPRHVKIDLAETVGELTYALWGERFDSIGDAGSESSVSETLEMTGLEAVPEQTPDLLNVFSAERANFVWFLNELGTNVLARRGEPVGAFRPELTPDAADMNWDNALDPAVFDAARHALAIYTQAHDAGLIVDKRVETGVLNFEDGITFQKKGPWYEGTDPEMLKFLNFVGGLAAVVDRFTGGTGELTLTPNMKWNSFYLDAANNVTGTLNVHVLQDGRYVDVENNRILDHEGLESQLLRMDVMTMVPLLVQAMLAVENGATSVAVSDVHREAAKKWYPQFNQLVEVVAARSGLKNYQVGAIVSALSPRALWDPDNVNWAILGVMEAERGPLPAADPAVLAELNETRQEAGFLPVDRYKGFGSALGIGRAKVNRVLAGMNPVEALRQLKTMAFLHNGLYPEGTPENSPFGRAIITADTHAWRAMTGFMHAVEPVWFKDLREVRVGEEWRSIIGEDLLHRLLAENEITAAELLEEGETLGEVDLYPRLMDRAIVPQGADVPSFNAERAYDAATRATVIVAELLGISPIEAQARLWQPVMEAASSVRGSKTVVWHDGIIKELEGRSPTSPNVTDALVGLDGQLIDPMSGHQDKFNVSSTTQNEPGIGILIASGPGGTRMYADPTVAGVTDQLRTAYPIPARPTLTVGKKEGLTLEPDKKVSPTKLDPVRFVPRISRQVENLAETQRSITETSPASEFRTASLSQVALAGDVHSPGNYIVVEVATNDVASVRQILETNRFPLDVAKGDNGSFQVIPVTYSAGARRASSKLTEADVSEGWHRRASENPFNTLNWAVIPADNRKVIQRLKRNGFSPIETYVRDIESGETRRALVVFGLTAESEFMGGVDTFWTQDGYYADGAFTPATADGISIGAGKPGTVAFQVVGDPGSMDFSMEYAADEGGPAGQAGEVSRAQVVVELGSVPDPAMVLGLWENLDRNPSTLGLSGYFHGALYADETGGSTGHPMTQVGEFSYTNGEQRMTQRARHTESLLEDEHYYTVWVPTSEALRLDLTHGAFPSKSVRHEATVVQKADNIAVIDGETTVIGTGESLEINPGKLLASKVDGEPVRVVAVTKDPVTGRPMVLMAPSEEAFSHSDAVPMYGFQRAAQFKVSSTGAVTGVTNDQLPFPLTRSVLDEAFEHHRPEPGKWPPGQWSEEMGKQEKRLQEQREKKKKKKLTESVFDMSSGLYDPVYAAEINDVFAAVQLLLRYGATKGAINKAFKNHPLATSLANRISIMRPVLEAKRTTSAVDETQKSHDERLKAASAVLKRYREDGDLTGVENWMIPAEGFPVHVNAVSSIAEGHTGRLRKARAKASTLSPPLQEVYKGVAREWIGDNHLVEGLEIPLLAGYTFPTAPMMEAQRYLVMHTLGTVGALTERPGFVAPANPVRDFPGIKWFRDRHGGVMFPGVAALFGSITVGAINMEAKSGAKVGGIFSSPWYAKGLNALTDRGEARTNRTFINEHGEFVPANGLHISADYLLGIGDLESFQRYVRLVWSTEDSNRLAARLSSSQAVSDHAGTFVAIHEFGHGVHSALIETGVGHIYREQLAEIIARHGGAGEVRRQLGRYASATWVETIPEAFTLTMVLGRDAPPMAREITDMMWDLLYQSDRGIRTIHETIQELWTGTPAAAPDMDPHYSQRAPGEDPWLRAIPFWSGTMSDFEGNVLEQGHQGPEGGLLPHLEHLSLGRRRSKKSRVKWDPKDLEALPDA